MNLDIQILLTQIRLSQLKTESFVTAATSLLAMILCGTTPERIFFAFVSVVAIWIYIGDCKMQKRMNEAAK